MFVVIGMILLLKSVKWTQYLCEIQIYICKILAIILYQIAVVWPHP